MRIIPVVVAVLVGLSAGEAAAQEAPAMPGMDHGAMDHGDAAASLPAACRPDGGDQSTSPGGGNATAPDLDAVQKANSDAMLAMHEPMMQAAMIKDPDLAFNCGMIAHHRGAIAMARVELAMGRDEASKALARAIIEAQEKEIAAMTAWVESHGR